MMKQIRTRKSSWILMCILGVAAGLAAQAAPSPEEILARVDRNQTASTISYSGTMEIRRQGRVQIKEMQSVAQGAEKAFVEFTNPEDAGTRYLKIDKNLWMYFPDEQETVRISGHLLKEGMMGSDLSYEDALESGSLADKYRITLAGTEMLGDRNAYVLNLEAKVREVNYERQKLWVDTERFVVLKSQLFAKSGKLLKESTALEVRLIGGRWFTTAVRMEDKLLRDSSTTFTMKDLVFDAVVAADQFSLRRLSR